MIPVTKTFLPPISDYQALLQKAWDAGWLTNRGILVKELEERLRRYLDVKNIIAMTNGTLPIQIAIKALELKGEIITTPFSYVATTSSLVWEGCVPVFVDIHPDYLTIDETQIENAITAKTTAILATHVFGNPCNVFAIEQIAKRYNLKVIYDAAHCFGVTYQGQSIFNYGDISTCSFHATKLFHTGEGGAIFCKDKYYDTVFYHHNFGHKGEEAFSGIGINAKMSELQAAMGLSVFNYIDDIITSRKQIVESYNELLKGSNLKRLKIRDETNWNYSYYPVIFETEDTLLEAKKRMNDANIFPRRYFYPSLNTLNYVSSTPMIIAEEVSQSILCLPLYHGLKQDEIENVVNHLKI